jgi:glycine oxidase
MALFLEWTGLLKTCLTGKWQVTGVMATMNADIDCIIVGGGLLGMLSARVLNQAGLSVTLLERGELCRESSWAGGGILSPLVPWEYPAAVSDLVVWSQARYPRLGEELQDQTGIDVEWVQSGLLMAGTRMDDGIRNWSEKYKSRIEIVEPEQLRACEAALADGIGASLLLPDVAQIRNPRLCKALRESLRIQGVDLHEHIEVVGLDVRQNAVKGINTDQGVFTADRVVIAAGAWSSQVLGTAGLDLSVGPVRGQMILFKAPPDLLQHIILQDGYYLIPRQDGLVLAGSTLEYVGFDKETSLEARDLLAERSRALVPGLCECEIVKQWAGLRPGTAQGIPFIGQYPDIRGLYMNTGHFRNGVVMAPASAQLLLDIMLERDSLTDPAPYSG